MATCATSIDLAVEAGLTGDLFESTNASQMHRTAATIQKERTLLVRVSLQHRNYKDEALKCGERQNSSDLRTGEIGIFRKIDIGMNIEFARDTKSYRIDNHHSPSPRAGPFDKHWRTVEAVPKATRKACFGLLMISSKQQSKQIQRIYLFLKYSTKLDVSCVYPTLVRFLVLPSEHKVVWFEMLLAIAAVARGVIHQSTGELTALSK